MITPLKMLNDLKLSVLNQAGRLILPQGFWQNNSNQSIPDCHLTFDDGPDPSTTPYLIELLFELDLKATFFFTGKNSKEHPHLVEDVANAGHQIGNHSLNHQLSLSQSTDNFRIDLDRTNKIIYEASGYEPKLYRPPYGLIDANRVQVLKDNNMHLVYWGALAEDWVNIGEKEVTRRILNQLQAGTIIVLHENADTVSQNLEATKNIVKAAQERELSFSTINYVD